MSMLSRARADLAAFRPYASARRSGFDARIRLDANECPWDDESALRLNRYPPPQPERLLARLAELYNVGTEQLWVGRGSDEAIDLLMRGFCQAGNDNIVTLSPTFGMYRVGAQLQGVEYRSLALSGEDGFAFDIECLLALTDADTKLVIICSPNNPTGTAFHGAALTDLAERLADRALLVVDEAYIEFSDLQSATSLIDRHDNVAVLRTLSKSYALAGARVGSLIAAPDVVQFVSSIAAPYPVPAPSLAAALQALQPDALARTRQRITQLISERNRVVTRLHELPEVRAVWPSAGNFLLVGFNDAPTAFTRALDAGVLVRDVSSQPGLQGCLRISIGRPQDNDTLLDALASRTVPATCRPIAGYAA